MTIPAILNARSGTAAAFRDALQADARFTLHEVEPAKIADAVRDAVADGATRVAVAGGDGSLAGAAAVLSAADVEMAVLPGGTLNHFAVHLGIPTDVGEALDVAADGEPCPVDVAYVGERLFVNTSAVGTYVTFVRLRDRLEQRLPYWLASLVAGLRLFLRLHHYAVEVEVEGVVRRYRTPLVFVGIGERELEKPSLAELVADGRPGLHVIVVRGRRRARLLALGLAAARRGPRGVASMPEVDSFVVERCRVDVRHDSVHLSADGEVVVAPTPLDYRVARGALRVVIPRADAAARRGTDAGAAAQPVDGAAPA